MAGTIEARLAELGISLPVAPAAAANYVPYCISGKQIFTAGQVPFVDGKLTGIGKVGDAFDVATAQDIARTVALNLVAVARDACDGDLDRIARIVKLVGFVNSTPDFVEQPAVINGASDLMVEIFGDKGRHARSAVGVAVLPFDVAVEIEAIFELA